MTNSDMLIPALQATADRTVGRVAIPMRVEEATYDEATDTRRIVLIEDAEGGVPLDLGYDGTRIVVEGSLFETDAFPVGRLFTANIELVAL